MPRRKTLEFLTYSQDVLLCELVSEHPSLYDLNHPDYKENVIRDKIWEKINVKMNLPENTCKSRWRNIRDCYKRNRRERLSNNRDANTRPKKQYALAEHLTFLEKVTEDEDKRSNPLLQQGEVIDADGDQMIPNIEMILDAANVDNYLCRRLKQEREDCEEDLECYNDYEKEEYENSGGVEVGLHVKHFADLDPTDALKISCVTSTSNLTDHVETPQYRHYKSAVTNSNKFRGSSNRKSFGRGKHLKRSLSRETDTNLHLQSKRKNQSEDFTHFMIQDQISQIPQVPTVQPQPCYEDDTDLFFQSMARSAKSLHPVLLAELKKKVCAVVMDSVIDSEKLFAKLQPQACYSTKTSPSGLEPTNQEEEGRVSS